MGIKTSICKKRDCKPDKGFYEVNFLLNLRWCNEEVDIPIKEALLINKLLQSQAIVKLLIEC